MAQAETQIIDLARIRADGWLEQLAEEVEAYDQLAEAVGSRFLAFSFVAGVQIVAVNLDADGGDATTVEFAVGEEATQTLQVGEFRERLGQALLGLPAPSFELPTDPSPDEIRDGIGRRYLLLAPVFGLKLLALHLPPDRSPTVLVELGGLEEELSLPNLRDVLDNAIRSEMARARPPSPFSIDFKKVPLAEEANRQGEYMETISMLGSWPGPLSMFVRTPQGQALGEAERGKLMRGLCALGEAYLCRGQADWAEDVLRLGIQFGQELPASGPLFAMLGRARLEDGRHGEAIGYLRRAMSLGGDQPWLLLALGECYLERGRAVAALACLERAEAQLGSDDDAAAHLREGVESALGDAYVKLGELRQA